MRGSGVLDPSSAKAGQLHASYYNNVTESQKDVARSWKPIMRSKTLPGKPGKIRKLLTSCQNVHNNVAYPDGVYQPLTVNANIGCFRTQLETMRNN
eukprot:5969887-Amphidinium_carterae.1